MLLHQSFDAEVAFCDHLFHESGPTQNSSAIAAIASPQALLLQITDWTILVSLSELGQRQVEKKDASQEQVTEEPAPLHLTSVKHVAIGVSSIAHTNTP